MKTKIIIKVLSFLKVVKTEGCHSNGIPITAGANKYNPLSYIIALPIILFVAFLFFFV